MHIEGTERPILTTDGPGATGSTDEAEVTEDNLKQVLQKPTTPPQEGRTTIRALM